MAVVAILILNKFKTILTNDYSLSEKQIEYHQAQKAYKS
jgi:hypothetical protein